MRVSKKHHSTDVVTICMLLLQWRNALQSPVGQRFESSSCLRRDNSVVE